MLGLGGRGGRRGAFGRAGVEGMPSSRPPSMTRSRESCPTPAGGSEPVKRQVERIDGSGERARGWERFVHGVGLWAHRIPTPPPSSELYTARPCTTCERAFSQEKEGVRGRLRSSVASVALGS